MSTKSDTIYDLVSRIERAPNVSRLIDAYDAAVGGSDVSAHRYRGQWQVWHGQASGFCGDFGQVRAHLAAAAEEILQRAAEAAAPAMVEQPVQQQQACAAPRVAMDLRRTVTTHGIVAVDVASRGPCPEFPDHGRDEYRVTADGKVIRTRYVLASDHGRWSSPGAKPFITPNRSTVTARRTIDAVAECLAAAPVSEMIPLPIQQQQVHASAALAEPVPAVPAQHTVEICAVANDYNTRMRGGTYYQILFRPDGAGGYLPGERADQADGAVILSRASYVDKHASYARARDRSSETRVRITLPVGTLRKSTRGWVKRLNADGTWSEIELVGNMRKGDGWATLVMIDDVEIELT